MDHAAYPLAIAFDGARRVAAGPLPEVALVVKRIAARRGGRPILVFDGDTSAPIDLDLRGSEAEVLARLEPPPKGPGRPKLGVVPREVTLLPRHWDWLTLQPGGASVTLRKLVDRARRGSAAQDWVRRTHESVYRFIAAMAGDRPHFEEATRALFAGDQDRFGQLIDRWPSDIKAHARALLAKADQVPQTFS